MGFNDEGNALRESVDGGFTLYKERSRRVKREIFEKPPSEEQRAICKRFSANARSRRGFKLRFYCRFGLLGVSLSRGAKRRGSSKTSSRLIAIKFF